MRDWVKIALGVGGGAALALVIALPIVLTGDSGTEVPEDPGAQRFPDTNFVTFEDYWAGTLGTKRFRSGFSKERPQEYVCVANDHYFSRKVDSYQVGEADYDKCDGKDSTQLTKNNWPAWKKGIVDAGNYNGCSLSADEKMIFCANNYMKQWRHSGYADYYVYDIENDKEVVFADRANLNQAQYCGWSPSGHNLVCVSNQKDIYVLKEDKTTFYRVTDDGGWCREKGHILGIDYPSSKNKCIYNGVPDWNYEEEMISTTNTIYWSPDSTHFAYVSFDVSGIEQLEYSVYPEHTSAASPNEIDENTLEQYPRLNTIRYAKAGGTIAKTKLWLYKLDGDVKTEVNPAGVPGSLSFEQGTGGDQENRWFTRFGWGPDSDWFVSIWSSRDSTQSKGLACRTDLSECKQSGREDGGVKGSWNGEQWTDDITSNGHGWVGSFGPFWPLCTKEFGTYFTIYSKKTGELQNTLHPFNLGIKDGYWNVALQKINEACNDQTLCGASWLTDSVSEKWVATQLDFYDLERNVLYFSAARSTNVGDHKTTEQYKRQVFSIAEATNAKTNQHQCETCFKDEENDSCEVVTMRTNGDNSRQIMACGGPEYPQDYMRDMTSAKPEWILMEDNRSNKEEHEAMNLARSKRILGVWENKDLGTFHNFEMFVPSDFNKDALDKKYPVFLEVYAGPEFQKISGSWKGSWPQVHMPGAYDCITLSVDGRGSAFQGDEFMFANYMALSQTERVDQTEFVRWFITQSEYADVVDKTRVSVYGWSYGGYTTTNIIGYGGGDRGRVFTSGVAVAPLADWRFYDAMYAERYMGFTGEKDELIKNPHWKNSSMIERNYNENKFANFGKAEYHLIHGTNDDNVHFLSAVQMEKGLVGEGIDFDNFFYADEDHSIRSTPIVQRHVYRNIITRIVESWGYKWNGGEPRTTVTSARGSFTPNFDQEPERFSKLEEAARLASPEL